MSHCIQEPSLTTNSQVQELVAKGRVAQAAFESFSQEQVDAIVKGIGKYVPDDAEMLAKMAVEETGIGRVEDKVLKNKGKARVIWNNLKDKKSRGIIGEDAEANMVFVAKPMGVVGAVTPITNPIVTPMCNAMFALKAGNAVVFAPHPKAERCTTLLTAEFMNIVKANGGPDDLVQMVRNGSIETTQELMKVVDVVVATGGGAMVKSAYSSGKPSFGVGAGNVPVIIDRDAKIEDAVEKIVLGASFDNGIICSHEQFVLTPEERYEDTLKLFEATGKVWFTADKDKIQKLREIVFPDGHLRRANQLGHYLMEMGVGPEVLVGVCLERSIEMVIALLGVWKAGGVYVPMDPSYPEQRLSLMMEKAGIGIVVAGSEVKEKLLRDRVRLIDWGEKWEEVKRCGKRIQEAMSAVRTCLCDLYLWFNRRPKGIMVAHRNLTSLLMVSRRNFGFAAEGDMLCMASFSFDISLFEVLNPMVGGGNPYSWRDQILELNELLGEMKRVSSFTPFRPS